LKGGGRHSKKKNLGKGERTSTKKGRKKFGAARIDLNRPKKGETQGGNRVGGCHGTAIPKGALWLERSSKNQVKGRGDETREKTVLLWGKPVGTHIQKNTHSQKNDST